jgi:FkbM family methyltransferase
MLLSYAQRLEDYHLALAFAGQTEGVYIDVGAGHPVADNVSYWFYLRGWSGLVVEPQENLLALYGPLRPRDRRVGTLVGREIGETDFHIVDRLHGLSTTVPANARMAEGYGVRTRTERRAVTTLAQLCESHGIGHIDFLKIDVEGAEWDSLLRTPDEVLQRIDQMAVEFHWLENEKYEWVGDEQYLRVVARLKQFFEIAHIHFNNASCIGDLHPFPSSAYEVLFVSKRLAEVDPARSGDRPHPRDAPNNPAFADCQPPPSRDRP